MPPSHSRKATGKNYMPNSVPPRGLPVLPGDLVPLAFPLELPKLMGKEAAENGLLKQKLEGRSQVS